MLDSSAELSMVLKSARRCAALNRHAISHHTSWFQQCEAAIKPRDSWLSVRAFLGLRGRVPAAVDALNIKRIERQIKARASAHLKHFAANASIDTGDPLSSEEGRSAAVLAVLRTV